MTQVTDDLEKVLLSTNVYDRAPFYWITIVIRYGLKDDNKPSYGRVNKKYGDLPLSIEINIEGKRHAPYDEILFSYRMAVLKALIHAGERYNLPTDELKSLLESTAS